MFEWQQQIHDLEDELRRTREAATKLAEAVTLVIEYHEGQHGEPGVIGCKAIDDMKDALAEVQGAQPANDDAEEWECSTCGTMNEPTRGDCRGCGLSEETPLADSAIDSVYHFATKRGMGSGAFEDMIVAIIASAMDHFDDDSGNQRDAVVEAVSHQVSVFFAQRYRVGVPTVEPMEYIDFDADPIDGIRADVRTYMQSYGEGST